jgi:hypothetical protein
MNSWLSSLLLRLSFARLFLWPFLHGVAWDMLPGTAKLDVIGGDIRVWPVSVCGAACESGTSMAWVGSAESSCISASAADDAVSECVEVARSGLKRGGRRPERTFLEEYVFLPPEALFAGVWLYISSSRSCCEAAKSSILGAVESIALVTAIYSIAANYSAMCRGCRGHSLRWQWGWLGLGVGACATGVRGSVSGTGCEDD